MTSHRLSTLTATLALGLAAPSFAAPPLMQNPAEIQRRVAALAEGVYPASDCSERTRGGGSATEPNQLRIQGGVMMMGSLSQKLFGPGQEIGMGWRGGKEPDFNWSVSGPGPRKATITSREAAPATGFLEMGSTPAGGGYDLDVGWTCATLDLRAMPLLSPAQPLRALMAELYDTGGREVTRTCQNLGQRTGEETRRARYSVSRQAIVLNGKTLPLQQVEELDLGSRPDDGTINGGFRWADGSNFHVEQFAGAPLSIANFGFEEGEARWYCQPGR